MNSKRNAIRFVIQLAVVAIAFQGLAQPQSHLLLVLSKQENSLAIIDPSTQKILGRVPTGEGPHEVAVSADGRFAFVGNYGAREPGSTISVIDLQARRESLRFDLGPLRRPHGIVFVQGKVYFTAEVNKLIGRFDPAKRQIDWMLGTGQDTTHMIIVSSDGAGIFTANIGSNSISAIEQISGAAGWKETVIPVGSGPEGMDRSPDGRELWAAHSRDGGISIIDVAAKKVTETFSIQTKRSNRLKFTPDGKLVLVSDLDAGDLVVIDAASRKVVRRIKLGRSPEGILLSPDGLSAYVAVAGDNQVAIVDLKSFDVTSRIEVGGGPDGMAWADAN